MKIRKLREAVTPGIAKLAYKILSPGDAKKAMEDIKETLSEKTYSPFKFEDFFVIEIENHIVTTGGIWALRHDPYIARLDWFMVDPGQQRKGLGTILLKKIQESLKKKKHAFLCFAPTPLLLLDLFSPTPLLAM
ncbi:MAG: GNAT family N-acetyltransferase [Candidatus Aenigmarchaeota archaeon]|nr:GNAT family N-acetyltransferase [Candidatus Aenigmarchaeota archaeon]